MITYQVERLDETTWGELKAMFPLHYDHLALNKDAVPLDPQYETYEARQAAGEVLLVTARELGKIIGYFVGFIAPGLHYRTCLTCTMDIFFIHPDHRGPFVGIKLFKRVEQELKRRGVQRWFVGSKLHADVGVLFKRLGFEPVEVHYSKMIG